MKETTLQNLIQELKNFSNFPMVDKATIQAAIDFAELRISDEKKQIIDAYLAGTSQFANDARIDYPKTPEEYYSEISKTK